MIMKIFANDDKSVEGLIAWVRCAFGIGNFPPHMDFSKTIWYQQKLLD